MFMLKLDDLEIILLFLLDLEDVLGLGVVLYNTNAAVFCAYQQVLFLTTAYICTIHNTN